MIIYAPIIADTIPGFLTQSVKIPFTMNPGVSWDEIEGFQLQIKEYNSSDVIATSNWNKGQKEQTNILEFGPLFSENWFPTPGQYYKFQLAYLYLEDDTEYVSSFSNASIGKCIGETGFGVKINGLSEDSDNNNIGVYFGGFAENVTITDPIYSYRFVFKDSGNSIIEDTGEILKTKDINEYKYKINYTIEDNDYCSLQFFITTINGYQENSPIYNIIEETSNPLNEKNKIQAVSFDNYGYIKLNITCEQNNYYSIERTKDKINFEELGTFNVNTETSYSFKDYSIEQGVGYYYSIRKIYEDGRYQSNRLFTENKVISNYEDIFLTDTNGKQLKIKFNPEVSSFKDVIQESKTETIGSKYPFFFRNGDIKYKEIPISGLISYNMDDSFMTNNELGPYTFERSTQLTSENYAAERIFKLKVMEWLNDGTPKLFRSPSEGVYVIRLMNISLSPNNTLGRMIHSFSTTGYEISESDLKTLKEKGFIKQKLGFEPTSTFGYFVFGTSTLAEDNNNE